MGGVNQGHQRCLRTAVKGAQRRPASCSPRACLRRRLGPDVGANVGIVASGGHRRVRERGGVQEGLLEAATGVEPVIKVLQSVSRSGGGPYVAIYFRESGSRLGRRIASEQHLLVHEASLSGRFSEVNEPFRAPTVAVLTPFVTRLSARMSARSSTSRLPRLPGILATAAFALLVDRDLAFKTSSAPPSPDPDGGLALLGRP